jgi:transcriptional regulator with XRE-family HTH domain
MAVKSDITIQDLRAWRIDRGLTQAQLAKLAGVGRATIARAESSEGVSVTTPAKIAKALGITVQELLHNTPGDQSKVLGAA